MVCKAPIWTWISGSNQPNQNTGSSPGAREFSARWQDASGNLYLFGGSGKDSAGTVGFLNDLWKFNTTTKQWQLVNGPTVEDDPGNYGTGAVPQGPNATLKPRARWAAASWTGQNGKFYLFGGQTYNPNSLTDEGLLDDFWEYDPNTNQWKLLNGRMNGTNPFVYYDGDGSNPPTSPAPVTAGVPTQLNPNYPPPRLEAAPWVDSATGNLCMFGGKIANATVLQANANPPPAQVSVGVNGPALNDVWCYDIGTNTWTKVAGAATVDAPRSGTDPGARFNPAVWEKGGKLTMFGGKNKDGGFWNDVWEFDPGTGTWTEKRAGTKVTNPNDLTADALGNYGIRCNPSGANDPGARDKMVYWTGTDGMMCMFGGYGYGDGSIPAPAAPNNSGNNFWFLNDSWCYDPATNEWTWMGPGREVGQTTQTGGLGGQAGQTTGAYGTLNQPDGMNWPGAREDHIAWVVGCTMYMFGGYEYQKNQQRNPATEKILNDLWSLDLITIAFDDFAISSPCEGRVVGKFVPKTQCEDPAGVLKDTLPKTFPVCYLIRRTGSGTVIASGCGVNSFTPINWVDPNPVSPSTLYNIFIYIDPYPPQTIGTTPLPTSNPDNDFIEDEAEIRVTISKKACQDPVPGGVKPGPKPVVCVKDIGQSTQRVIPLDIIQNSGVFQIVDPKQLLQSMMMLVMLNDLNLHPTGTSSLSFSNATDLANFLDQNASDQNTILLQNFLQGKK